MWKLTRQLCSQYFVKCRSINNEESYEEVDTILQMQKTVGWAESSASKELGMQPWEQECGPLRTHILMGEAPC